MDPLRVNWPRGRGGVQSIGTVNKRLKKKMIVLCPKYFHWFALRLTVLLTFIQRSLCQVLDSKVKQKLYLTFTYIGF